MRHMEYQGGRDSVNMQKLQEAVHYICSNCTPSDRLGAVKLNKILYYSDMISFAETGESITAATYVKRQRGPVPKEVVTAIDNLVADGRLETRNISVFDLVRRNFESQGHTDTDVFKSEEIERLNSTIRFVCDYSAQEISDLSHTIVWESADIGEVLPYETFFVSYTGEIDDTDLAAAMSVLKKVENEGRTYV